MKDSSLPVSDIAHWGYAGMRRSLVVRAEEGEKKAAAPTKPAIGPKRGSMVRRAVAWLALPVV